MVQRGEREAIMVLLVGLVGVVLTTVRGERETAPSAVGRGSSPASSGMSEACTLPTTSKGERSTGLRAWALACKSARSCARASALGLLEFWAWVHCSLGSWWRDERGSS